MVIRRVVAPRIDFSALRRERELPTQFPLAAQGEADRAAAAPPRPATDRTDIPFVTIDPATSRDLDQAMCLRRRPGGGYRVYYAIADVAAHVRPGGALEAETWRRGQTVYLPDGKIPLHPETLSENAASLVGEKFDAAVVDVDNHPTPAGGGRGNGGATGPASARSAPGGKPAAGPVGGPVGGPPGSAPASGRPGRRPGGTVALDQPPVRARCEGELPLGERVRVRLVTADPVTRKVLFERA